MNLLNFKDRFKKSAFLPTNVNQVTGYMWAMQDLLKLLQDITQFNPEKRMVDSVDLLNAITETNAALMNISRNADKELQGAFTEMAAVNLGSDKVRVFMKELTLSDTEKEIEQEMKDHDDLKNIDT